MGKLAAVKLAIACGPSSASRSAAASHACHRAARVISAAASTTASGTLQGRMVAALMRRATDSPRTISTKIRNRSARAPRRAGRQAHAKQHPQPPDGREDHHEAGECTERRVLLQSARELSDRSHEHQIKEELEPASRVRIEVVAIGGTQRRRAEVDGLEDDWMRRAGTGISRRSPSHHGPDGPRRAWGSFLFVKVASESPSPRWPYQCTRWASRSCCGRGADGRDVGTADRRESSGFLSGRLSTIQRGMPEMAPMNTTAAGILSQNQRGMSVSVLEVLPAPCVLVTDAGVCLTDSTLGAERHRQIGCSYGDLHLRNLDLNRGIGRTTEPGPKPGVRLGRKRLSSRPPSRRRSGTVRRRPRRPRAAGRPAAHATGPVRRRRT